MAKRPRGSSSASARAPEGSSPAQLLSALKRAWRVADWEAARLAYNTWTNRTGRKRDPRLEREMLFRAASSAFGRANYGKALANLDESNGRGEPPDSRRYALCKAICLARMGRLRESIELSAASGEDLQAAAAAYLVSRGSRLRAMPAVMDPAFEPGQLLSFWRNLSDPQAPDPSSAALRCVRRAYHSMLQGEEPDAVLEGLERKPGFERLAVGLMLVAAVALRRPFRVRNILSGHPEHFRDDWSLSVIDAHLELLLREGEYREIEAVEGILASAGLRPPGLDRVRDERLFADGLREAETGRWERARMCFAAVSRRTPAALHNLALVCQRSGSIAEANEHWIALLKMEKRPSRSDSEQRRLAYATAAKAIAANYLAEDMAPKAIPLLKDAHALCGDDPELLEDLAEACLEAGSDAEALAYARKRYLLSPESEDAFLMYAMAVHRTCRPDLLIAFFDEQWERVTKMRPVAVLFSDVYAQLAWTIREKDPPKARRIAEKVREIAPDDPFLLYLEGSNLTACGRPGDAAQRYERVVEETEGHSDQCLLGMALYADGYSELSSRMFRRIVECGCDRSIDALYDIVSFLAKKGDPQAAARLCSHGVDACGLELYSAADSLLEAGEPFLAREFSLRLVDEPGANEMDHFLHLLILNACGEAAETLAFAERSMARFKAADSEEGYIEVLADVVKQIRSKGWAKIRHERN